MFTVVFRVFCLKRQQQCERARKGREERSLQRSAPPVSKRDVRQNAETASRERYSSAAVVKMQGKNRRQTNRMLNSIGWHDKRLHMASWMLWCHRRAMSLIGSCSKSHVKPGHACPLDQFKLLLLSNCFSFLSHVWTSKYRHPPKLYPHVKANFRQHSMRFKSKWRTKV